MIKYKMKGMLVKGARSSGGSADLSKESFFPNAMMKDRYKKMKDAEISASPDASEGFPLE